MSYTPSTEYPNVIRVADPLLIRVDELSLLVDNTSFWAKIKYGIQCKGFFIYVSGISMPIHEETFSDEKSSSSGSSAGGVKIITTERVGSKIDVEKKAKEWMDDLEEKIATSKSDNEIKRALDRMCWQLHYDITQSDTDFVTAFADQGFSDTIGIDYKQIGSSVPTNCYPAAYLYPVRETAMDSAHEITGQSGSGGGYGSLYDISAKIGTLDSNMNVGSGTLVTLNTNMVTLNGNIKGSGDTYTVCGAMTKIATNLRETNDEYTISKALRDNSSEESVSGQLKLQTTEITNGLGSSGAINTSLSSISGTTSDIKNAVGTTYTTDGTLISNLKNTITRIGNTSDTNSTTLLGHLNRIRFTLGGDASTTLWTNVNSIQSDTDNMDNNTQYVKNQIHDAVRVADGSTCFLTWNKTSTWGT